MSSLHRVLNCLSFFTFILNMCLFLKYYYERLREMLINKNLDWYWQSGHIGCRASTSINRWRWCRVTKEPDTIGGSELVDVDVMMRHGRFQGQKVTGERRTL